MSKLPRPSTERERLELKDATRRSLSLLGKLASFAAVTRVEVPVLSKYGSPSETTAFMPIDVALDLARDTGSLLIVETLAAMLGYRLVPLDGAPAEKIGIEDLGALMREGNDVEQKLTDALADGVIDPAERRELRQEIAENVLVLRRLDRKLGGQVNG